MDVALGNYIINKINRLHVRPWRIVYSDYTSSFEGLLDKNYFFNSRKKYLKYSYRNLQIRKWIISLTLTHMHFEIGKIFIPEILRHLDMKLKPCQWHLTFGARFLQFSK